MREQVVSAFSEAQRISGGGVERNVRLISWQLPSDEWTCSNIEGSVMMAQGSTSTRGFSEGVMAGSSVPTRSISSENL
ncbi:unnamed protein product [Linum trigynum]|uniref:Uncharacterized protein n=1 Tax=Linum trigynum TaxID=586398 RepID=A0AAV2CWX8_9ROSI